MFKRTLLAVARSLQRVAAAVRGYAAAAGGRLTSGWRAPQSTADAELHDSLQTMRGRSRELVRNSAYAKRAKVIVVNNVIGAGIGMQAQVRPLYRDRLDEAVNAAIESAWERWSRADSCHTGGRLHFADFERAVMGEVFEAGEVFIRLHTRQLGTSKVPLALELIEAERLADNLVLPEGVNPERYRMGVEVDEFQRPVAYWVREKHPGDVRPYAITGSDRLIRVAAEQMLHLCVVERWPQSRGVPWLHATMRRLNDMDGYGEAEIVAARGGANYMAAIKVPEGSDPLVPPAPGDAASERPEIVLEPGTVAKLEPGEEMVWNNPSRPNPNFDPFMRAMLREVAAGIGVSYESLSRDYSQSNYSSSRLALIDDRDLWRSLQLWFIRSFREPLHRAWLQAAVLSGAIPAISQEAYALNTDKFEAVKWKPRGWSWVDPTKEVAAYKQAIMGGLITRTDVIAMTANGLDIEDVDATREQELEDARARGLVFDTDPGVFAPPPPAPAPAPTEQSEPEDEAATANDDAEAAAERVALREKVNRLERQLDLQSVLRLAPAPVSMAIEPGAIVVHNTPPAVNVERTVVNVQPADVRIEQPPQVINVAAPEVRIEQSPAVVNVSTPDITVNVPEQAITFEATMPSPVINVRAADQPTPIVNVPPQVINVAAPEVTVLVDPTIEAKLQQQDSVTRHERNAAGDLVKSTTTYGT